LRQKRCHGGGRRQAVVSIVDNESAGDRRQWCNPLRGNAFVRGRGDCISREIRKPAGTGVRNRKEKVPRQDSKYPSETLKKDTFSGEALQKAVQSIFKPMDHADMLALTAAAYGFIE
jgi:hypothetical protein